MTIGIVLAGQSLVFTHPLFRFELRTDCHELLIKKGIVSLRGVVELPGVWFNLKISAIDVRGFSKCSGIEKIVLHMNIKSLWTAAFNGCTDLTNIEMPGVTDIGYASFGGCSGLKQVILPESLISVGIWAFAGCNNIQTITIPSGVINIAQGAFSSCSNLGTVSLKSIKPPRASAMGGKAVPWIAFEKCPRLKKIYVPIGSASEYKKAFGWREYAHLIVEK